MDEVDSSPSQDIPTSRMREVDENDPMSVSYRVITDDQLQTNIKIEVNDDDKLTAPIPYTSMSYGPINVRVYSGERPTLKTGRRSKFLVLDGDAALRREKRRELNRKCARRFQEKQVNVANQLINKITDLESHQTYLLSQIEHLQSHRTLLEEHCQQIISFEKCLCNEDEQIKIEFC